MGGGEEITREVLEAHFHMPISQVAKSECLPASCLAHVVLCVRTGQPNAWPLSDGANVCMSLAVVAEFKVCLTYIKRKCRAVGIMEWPYRTVPWPL
jgi:hypothetical protein